MDGRTKNVAGGGRTARGTNSRTRKKEKEARMDGLIGKQHARGKKGRTREYKSSTKSDRVRMGTNSRTPAKGKDCGTCCQTSSTKESAYHTKSHTIIRAQPYSYYHTLMVVQSRTQTGISGGRRNCDCHTDKGIIPRGKNTYCPSSRRKRLEHKATSNTFGVMTPPQNGEIKHRKPEQRENH